MSAGGTTSPSGGASGGSGGSSAMTSGGQPMIGSAGWSSFAGSSAHDFQECARATLEAEPSSTNLLFVIDTSGSMNCNPPEGDTALAARCARYPVQEDKTRPSKWQVTKTALTQALQGLLGRGHLKVGLSLFPELGACGAPKAPRVPLTELDQAQFDALNAALSGVSPSGETPLAASTIRGYGYLADQIKQRAIQGNSFVVLLTDGTETCAPNLLDDLLTVHAPNARLFQIRTFVIGVPGSEAARSFLSNLAYVGGTAEADCAHPLFPSDSGDCHLDTTRSLDLAQDLAKALERVTSDREIACTLDVPRNPNGGDVDFEKVNVTFTTQSGEVLNIPNDPESACNAQARGWQYSNDRRRISLCGTACSDVRAEPGTLEIVLGCPTEIIR